MTTKNIILTVIAVAALAAAAYITMGQFKTAASDEGLDGLTYWVCADESCKTEFKLTKRELQGAAEHGGEGGVKCPTCGKHFGVMAHPCPKCERLMEAGVHGRMPSECPHCKAKLGGWSTQLRDIRCGTDEAAELAQTFGPASAPLPAGRAVSQDTAPTPGG